MDHDVCSPDYGGFIETLLKQAQLNFMGTPKRKLMKYMGLLNRALRTLILCVCAQVLEMEMEW